MQAGRLSLALWRQGGNRGLIAPELPCVSHALVMVTVTGLQAPQAGICQQPAILTLSDGRWLCASFLMQTPSPGLLLAESRTVVPKDRAQEGR